MQSSRQFHFGSLETISLCFDTEVKYLWLLFDLAVGPDNLVENGPYKYIFSTEGHLLPATPQISLVREHCSYYGAYCNSSSLRQEYKISHDSQDSDRFSSDSANEKIYDSGSIKGSCPGLTHGQKYGISYYDTVPREEVDSRDRQRQTPPEKSHPIMIFSDTSSMVTSSNHKKDKDSPVLEQNQEKLETELPQR